MAFATTLARAGFAVLAPEMPGFRQMRVRPSDAQEIADAFSYLVSRPELAPDGRAGMFAFSYAVGPALLAALRDDIREQVRFVVGLGGYHDLPRAMRFFTTGWFEHEGRWRRITPDDTGRMVLAALPEAMRADMERLNLARHDLKPLRARLLLVHGRNDNLIPWPESLALAAAAPEGQAEVFLIHRVLGHVDLSFSSLFSWRFWSEDLPDLWRLWRVIDLLLAEREDSA